MTGIYVITNITNLMNYVGSSVCIHKRWNEHKWALGKGIHENSHLQRAWNKYGEEAFSFNLVEECQVTELIEREQFWIDFLEFDKLYNQSKSASSPMLGRKHSEESKAKMSEQQKGKPRSIEQRIKQSATMKAVARSNSGSFKKGHIPSNTGESRSPETCAKISVKLKGHSVPWEGKKRGPYKKNIPHP